ncbi:hypothetical protein BGZ97_009053 [Linnemannia gamsii]|uniref:Kazal-like domain-containing protein n=1 Tax=Linnemannia gamsii TaxID=64522 RepID=A0A9P6R8E8_9FUNG|nr:hypothetical protein BGZ97_009053 [Linnemannia gamsii]
MSFAFLIVILSVQVQVQAGPIPLPAAAQERRGDKDPGVQAKSVNRRTAVTETTPIITGEQEPGATGGAPPKECPKFCTQQIDTYCATNNKGQRKEFSNSCALEVWNCENPSNTYKDEVQGKCDSK